MPVHLSSMIPEAGALKLMRLQREVTQPPASGAGISAILDPSPAAIAPEGVAAVADLV